MLVWFVDMFLPFMFHCMQSHMLAAAACLSGEQEQRAKNS